MKFNKLIKNRYLQFTLVLIVGFFGGWLIFHNPPGQPQQEIAGTETKKTIWTCSMHPQVRRDEPGPCPICGMDLIPLNQDAVQIDPNSIAMTEDAARIAEVQTMIVASQVPVKEVRLYGKIQADERLLQTQSAHLAGRIEQLMVNFTGEEVRKGQAIAQIYSPSVVTAQQELFEALKMEDTAIISAAREKLRQWKFTDAQIAGIEQSGQVKTVFDVTATVSGIVIAKKVNRGDYVQQGTALYEIADLSHVWALFDAYESDLPWIRSGDKVTFTLQSYPSKEFSGVIAFIDPVINAQTRVAQLRVEVANGGNLLKPEMFATGHLTNRLAGTGNNLVIPQSAVLWTGTRSIVYIKVPNTAEPTFLLREITLGPDLGNSFVVHEGLSEGEEIVINGTFNIDASAQLMGKPSMMNQAVGKTPTMPGMDVSMDFIMQLNTVSDRYIGLKNAFVQTDVKKVMQAAREFNQSLSKVDMKLLTGDAHLKWMDIADNLGKQINVVLKSEKIEEQRLAFSGLSDQFYKAVKTFGLMGKTVYYQFCPMAFDNKGAYWLSETDQISNPYFGQAMLTCGETREIIKN
ncbi:MAG: hypothetical protein A2X22_04015 [Bacteroidetes bacterium GWF2_49_14]|nr:MAG: hypothetical protein A2X22_04015 [Bacteroidetes bacterium GWF2_49_14]